MFSFAVQTVSVFAVAFHLFPPSSDTGGHQQALLKKIWGHAAGRRTVISDVKAELQRRAHYNVGNQNWYPQSSERRDVRVRKKSVGPF